MAKRLSPLRWIKFVEEIPPATFIKHHIITSRKCEHHLSKRTNRLTSADSAIRFCLAHALKNVLSHASNYLPTPFVLFGYSDCFRLRTMPRRSTTHHPDSRHSVRRRAYLFIQKKIASGELKAGTLISEVALTKELGSSRTPVREAAGQLLAEGLFKLSPGGGIIVTQITPAVDRRPL